MFGRAVLNGNTKAHRRESAGRSKFTIQELVLKELDERNKFTTQRLPLKESDERNKFTTQELP
jgi:hypothetical protein